MYGEEVVVTQSFTNGQRTRAMRAQKRLIMLNINDSLTFQRKNNTKHFILRSLWWKQAVVMNIFTVNTHHGHYGRTSSGTRQNSSHNKLKDKNQFFKPNSWETYISWVMKAKCAWAVLKWFILVIVLWYDGMCSHQSAGYGVD